jgi:tetratricopeptide (TPR) repeat protein
MLWVTLPRNRDWRSNLALWRETVASAPDNAKARHNLARVLLGRPDGAAEAVIHLDRAVALSRNLPGDELFEPWLNLGTVQLRQAAAALEQGRMTEEARRRLERAVGTLEEGVERSEHRGRRHAWFERAVEARAELLGGVRPAFGDARLNLALASGLDALGRTDEARRQLEKANAIDPLSPTPYLRLAAIDVREGRIGQARILLAVAVGLPRRGPEDETLIRVLAAAVGAPGATSE